MFLKQSTQIVVKIGPYLDRTDGVTEETGLAGAATEISKSPGAAFAAGPTLGTHDAEGWYPITLTTTHTDTVGRLVVKGHDSATHLPVWHEFYVVEEAIYDALYAASSNAWTGAAGSSQVRSVASGGIAAASFAAGAIDAAAIGTAAIDADAIATDAITAAKIAANAIGSSELATDAIGDAQIATGAIAATAFAAGAIDAAAIATDAIGSAEFAQAAADKIWSSATRNLTALGFSLANSDFSADAIDANALAADAVTEIRSLVSGTSDAGGSTTTMVDAARTEADDIWNYKWLLFTSGTVANECRLITDFDAATDTVTFAPAVSASVGAGITYEILPAAAVDIQSWLGTLTAAVAPNALVSGRVDADVGAITGTGVIVAATFGAGAIDAAAIATDAIDADAIAANAIGSSELATDAIGDAQIATGAIAATAFAAGAIDAAAIGTGAIDADAIATDAITAAKIAAGAITATEAPNLDAAISTRATPTQVNTEVSDVLKTDTVTLPGQTAPPLAPTLEQAISWLYKVLRNRKAQTATTWSLYADDEATVDAKATVSDDGTTAIKQEIVTGP